MTITPADLAVGQVWLYRDKHEVAKRIIDELRPDGIVAYTRVLSNIKFSDQLRATDFVAMVNTGPMELEVPAPHPAALADLYEACKEVLQGLELTGSHGSHWATVLRAALAKAGGK